MPQPDTTGTDDTTTTPAPALELLEGGSSGSPRLEELERALDPAPQGEPAAASSSAGPTPAPGVTGGSDTPPAPGFKRWTRSRLKDATRKDMQGRIRELEETLEKTMPAAAPGGAPAPAVDPAALVDETRKALVGTFGVVSQVAGRLRGEHWKLTDLESEQLAAVWAPVMAPHLGSLAGYLPLGAAVLTTAQIVWPRVERDMQLAKLEAAAPVPSPALEVAPAS